MQHTEIVGYAVDGEMYCAQHAPEDQSSPIYAAVSILQTLEIEECNVSCWDLDLPPETPREQLRRADSGRYSLVLTDSDADDFEEVCTCVACATDSTATLAGRAGWLVLNRRNGTTLALCAECAETATPARRSRRD